MPKENRSIQTPERKAPQKRKDATADVKEDTTEHKGEKAEVSTSRGPAAEQKKKPRSLVGTAVNSSVGLIAVYAAFVASRYRTILWPTFPDVDPRTHKFLPRFQNTFKPGDACSATLWVDEEAWPRSKQPLVEFDFAYQWDGFKTVTRKINTTVDAERLLRGGNMILSATVRHAETGATVKASGGLVKSMEAPELRPKYHLPTGAHCPETPEPKFGRKPKHIGRGIPQMQVRLVFDDTAYPPPWARSEYVPQLFVDEFAMTDDQLIKLNATGESSWETEIAFDLMGVARWRFQRHMEASFAETAKVFGEDSEEMLQTRDLFANTSPWLLTVTLVVSVLHMIFEFLAFKHDVQFFQGVDVESLNKFVSVQSIAWGIVLQVVLLLYLWDEAANMLVLVSSLVMIAIDVWKVQRAMKVQVHWCFGCLPLPSLVSKVSKEKVDDFDSIAMKWLGIGLAPFVLAYAGYSLAYECHRGWYSYFLFVSSSCVYSVGFILMTPQVFINYKHKTVAYLPWKKFIYRAINTFIDDLFALIIRMPTMHRLSCFRDDIVFFIYLYQRQIYKVDKNRMFDEDGFELDVPQADDSGDAKKDK